MGLSESLVYILVNASTIDLCIIMVPVETVTA